MLFKLNHIRNKANAIHLIQQIKLNNVKRTVNRFPFQNIIVNLGLANRNETSVEVFLPQMKLNLIDKTLRFALSQRAIAARSKHEYGDAFIFSALLELDNNELVYDSIIIINRQSNKNFFVFFFAAFTWMILHLHWKFLNFPYKIQLSAHFKQC